MSANQTAVAKYDDGTTCSVGDKVLVDGKAGTVRQVVAPFPQPQKVEAGQVVTDFDKVEWQASVELDAKDAHGRVVTVETPVLALERA